MVNNIFELALIYITIFKSKVFLSIFYTKKAPQTWGALSYFFCLIAGNHTKKYVNRKTINPIVINKD